MPVLVLLLMMALRRNTAKKEFLLPRYLWIVTSLLLLFLLYPLCTRRSFWQLGLMIYFAENIESMHLHENKSNAFILITRQQFAERKVRDRKTTMENK